MLHLDSLVRELLTIYETVDLNGNPLTNEQREHINNIFSSMHLEQNIEQRLELAEKLDLLKWSPFANYITCAMVILGREIPENQSFSALENDIKLPKCYADLLNNILKSAERDQDGHLLLSEKEKEKIRILESFKELSENTQTQLNDLNFISNVDENVATFERHQNPAILVSFLNRYKLPQASESIDRLINDLSSFSTDLKFLFIENTNQVTKEDMIKLISAFPNLEELTIKGGDIEPDALEELSQLRSLQVLKLNNLNINAFPLAITNLTELKKLSLANCHIESIPPEISNLTNLQELNLENNPIREWPSEIGVLHRSAEKYLLYPPPETRPQHGVPEPERLSPEDHPTEVPLAPGVFVPPLPPGAFPPGAFPPGAFTPGAFPPYPPPGAFPPGEDPLPWEGENTAYAVQRMRAHFEELDPRISSDGHHTIFINLDPDTIDSDYMNLIIELADHLDSNIEKIHVTLQGNAVIDSGAVSRYLLTRLFALLQKDFISNQWPTWPTGSKQVDAATLFTSVGVLMAFLVKLEGRITLGPLLNPNIYHTIANCSDGLILKEVAELDAIDCCALIGVQKISDMQLTSLCFIIVEDSYTDASKYFDEAKKNLEILEFDIPTNLLNENGEFKESEFLAVQKFCSKIILDQTKNLALPIYYIMQGMTRMQSVWENRSSIDLQGYIQGKFSKDGFINVLETTNEPENNTYKQWVDEWIQEQPEEKAKDLLQHATGLRSLSLQTDGKVRPITIRLKDLMQNTVTQACFYELEFPKGLSRDQVRDECEKKSRQLDFNTT